MKYQSWANSFIISCNIHFNSKIKLPFLILPLRFGIEEYAVGYKEPSQYINIFKGAVVSEL